MKRSGQGEMQCHAVVGGLPEVEELPSIYINKVKSLGLRLSSALKRLLEFKTPNNSLIIHLKKGLCVCV